MSKRRCLSSRNNDINPEDIVEWSENFKADPVNILTRNAVVSVGSEYAAIDADEARKVNHIFINTLKKHNLKATNQAYSGRCWLFAGLNNFRHLLIKALDLENFEFSETYLFFWDKLERSNYFLQWFIDNPQYGSSSREAEYMLTDYLDDGGYWNMFVNLISKYGVIPKTAMPETFQSGYSDDMNATIHEYLTACVAYITRNRKKLKKDNLSKLKKNTLKQIYNILVKYLGQPPQSFTWFFTLDQETE